MTNFNDTMTDLALALISIVCSNDEKEIDEILADIEKLFPELSNQERSDLEPGIRKIVAKLTDR